MNNIRIVAALISITLAGTAAHAQTYTCDSPPNFEFRIQKNSLRVKPQNHPRFCVLPAGTTTKIEVPMDILVQPSSGGSSNLPDVSRVWVQEKDESTAGGQGGDCSVSDADGDAYNVCGYIANPGNNDTLVIEVTKQGGAAFGNDESVGFDLYADGVGIIDPRIAIVDTGEMRGVLEDTVIDLVLDELGIRLMKDDETGTLTVPVQPPATTN
jgi:hypothetical protein